MDIKRNRTRIKKLFYQTNWIQYTLSLAIFITILLSSSIVYLLVDKQFKKNAKATLTTVLNSTNQTITTWANEQQLIAKNFIKNQEVIIATKALLKVPITKISLAKSSGQRQINTIFTHQLKSPQYHGFFLVGPGNIN